MSDTTDLNLLMEMGFSAAKAEKALSATGNKGVEAAMEWLIIHAEEMETEESGAAAESEKAPETETDAAEETIELNEESVPQPKSIKCDECNKKFRTDSEIEFHAVKTGHQKFSQSAEEIKPLSEEEKREQVKKLEVLIKQRRAEKAEKEKKEALEKEKTRRKTGQEITHVRQKIQEDEMKRLAELKRQEKLEAKIARQKVLEQIERDKQARREKFGMPNPNTSTPSAPSAPAPVPVAPSISYDECKLQIRLTNGQCLTQTFKPNEELAAVRLYVEMNRTDGDGPFTLMTNFPKKVFTSSDMNCPLSELGLVPSAVIIVSKNV
ncbi:UBX domain-containing protein 1-B isoform X2 [Parasteatoda tepidariorum]|nr:UBX domain-containing protein 1-B isoform X2 [Parasteatoda tepidariorum]